jgi:hypothetical protein
LKGCSSCFTTVSPALPWSVTGRDGRDLPVEAAVFVGLLAALGGGDRKRILRFAGELVLGHALFGERAHRAAALVGVFQPVDGHVVEDLRRAVAHALARKHEMRRVGHALHAAGHEHVGALGLEHVVREHHRAHARAAHLREGDRPCALRQPGTERRLARGRLALAGHEAVAHQHFVDGGTRKAGALDRGPDGHGPEVMRRKAAEVAQQAADGRARGGHDDDGFGGHGTAP